MNDAAHASGVLRLAGPVVLGALVLACGARAVAHDRSVSYSTWNISGRHAHVTVRLSDLDASAIASPATEGRDSAVGIYLTERLRLVAGHVACLVGDGPRVLEAGPGRMMYEWRLDCPATGALHLESSLLLDVIPSHLHFARVSLDGGPFAERVLSDSERMWEMASTDSDRTGSAGTSVWGYLALGVAHIATGYDHLAFLVALLLIGGSLSDVAKVVTGFTVAHSITLALAVLGYVRPERAAIEALIGLSIALVAAENVWLTGRRNAVLPWSTAAMLGGLALAAALGFGRVPALTLAGLALFTFCYFGLVARVRRPAPLRWAIAFVFGLVHGFGFAAVLVEANVSAERLLRALFGFNAGVEIGQLAVVALSWPLLQLVLGRTRLGWIIVDVSSAAVFGLGVFWFVNRAYG